MLIVLSGLAFAGIQFYISMKQMSVRKKSEDNQLGSGTNLELSASGIKVTSSVLGIIILAISIGFFYLYLAHVYPIKFLDLQEKQQAAEKAVSH